MQTARDGEWIAWKKGREVARSETAVGVLRVLRDKQIKGAVSEFRPASTGVRISEGPRR